MPQATELQFFTVTDETFPNLDGFVSPDDLDAFQIECHNMEQSLAKLRSYAESKSNAVQMRLKGRIDMAVRFEAAADKVYADLPDFMKW